MHHRTLAFILVLACATSLPAQPSPKLQLQPGDHVAIIGSALPDRMQHSGYLESLIHAMGVPAADFGSGDMSLRTRSARLATPSFW